MSNSKLIELSYYDPSAQVRLSAYADTLVLDHDQNGSIISAIRFGGYPEMVRAMADAIYGGATIEAAQNDTTRMLQSSLKSYQRQITHDGIYAVATLMAADTVQEDDRSGKHEKDEDTNLVDTEQMELQPRRCYIFCPARDQKRLFEELDRKTAAPLIPEFQDYVLSSLRQRGDLRQLEVISLKERIDAWVLDLKPQDQNVVEVLERGLQSGDIQIPGAVPNMPDGFENVENVTGYLNTFGVTVADRIRSQFMPLFDPAKEPLSDEVLATKRRNNMVAGHLQTKKGYYYMVLNLKSEDGNRKSKWISTGIPATGKKSAKLAEEMLAETRCTYKDAASPCAVSPVISREDISFSDYMIKWLGIIKNSVEVDTYAGYVNNIEKRIVPYFRGQRILLRELTALDVENFYSYCFNELHLKGTTVQRFHANIHKAMKYARKHDLIASNPMDNVERPKSQRYVGAFYSVSELETLFQAVKGDPCEFPVLMAAFYGLRRSEIMGLRWRAIDFENNLITIDHTVVQCMCDGTTITVEKDRTKNQSSCRSMPLVPQYRDLLLRMKVRQECCRKLCGNCYTESEYIFVNDMGEPYQPNYVTQHFKLVLRKNHLRSIRFHDLRHTCASLLLKNGVPMKDIQEWLGHSSYNTTANIYAHLDTSSKNTSASKMSNVVIIEPSISTSV